MRVRPALSITGSQRISSCSDAVSFIVGHLPFTFRLPKVPPSAIFNPKTAEFGGSRFICPNSGKKLHFSGPGPTVDVVPADRTLVARLVATTCLREAEAARVGEDVLAFHAEQVEAYFRRRHAELKTYGARNPEIFAQLAEELVHLVVAAPVLSERQLRRIVYG